MSELRVILPQLSEVWGPLALAGEAAVGRALIQGKLNNTCQATRLYTVNWRS